MTLSNINEANGVLIENLPITILAGDIGAHLDNVYMVNTKKLDSIVKGSGAVVNFLIEDGSKIVIGENKRRYELSLFSLARKDPQEVQMLGYNIDVKTVLKNMADSDCITTNSTVAAMSGSLFSGTAIMSSDRISGLFIHAGGVFGEGVEDIMLCPDLFSACLAKTKVKEAEPGFTAQRDRFVLKFDNVTLYKSILTEKFPKESLMQIVDNVKQAYEGKLTIPVIKAVINLDDFKVKLKELRSIVESNEYFLSYNRDNCLHIKSHNIKGGTDGEAIIDAQVTMPDGIGDTISALFTHTHLELIGKLFPAGSDITLISTLNTKAKSVAIRYAAVYTEEKSYFFVPMER
jgi:hypothetical protein